MKTRSIITRLSLLGISGTTMAVMALGGTASAVASGSTSTTSPSAAQQQDLQNIITKGNAEITRRLDSLNSLSSKISGTTKLTASDKTYLTNEVATEITGLTSLKTQLDADTTVTTARTDAMSIFSEYRVYALVLPKVWLVKTADDQQVTEAKLSTLATKLQAQITADQTAGKDVSSLQTTLTAMTTLISSAQTISSGMESSVLPLQPSDYDSDHSLLSGDAAQLKMAHSDNETAFSDANTIVTGLKSL
jgi:uncharacterized protein YlxW (UPF0749 family)